MIYELAFQHWNEIGGLIRKLQYVSISSECFKFMTSLFFMHTPFIATNLGFPTIT